MSVQMIPDDEIRKRIASIFERVIAEHLIYGLSDKDKYVYMIMALEFYYSGIIGLKDYSFITRYFCYELFVQNLKDGIYDGIEIAETGLI